MLQPSKYRFPFVLLAVLDGWGISENKEGNAIALARTPNFDKYWSTFPHSQLGASGESVGLPRGEVGNTETGHLNLGAGRIVYQDLARINMSIADGSFFSNEVLNNAIDHAKTHNSKLHFMGLVGAGGVHSNIEHLYALIQLASRKQFDNVFIHVFTDGRDSSPRSAMTYISQLQELMKREGVGQIASVMGRYWAMDRDQRWDRTAKAYFALTRGEGARVRSVQEAVESSYNEGKTDEFIEPALITGRDNMPVALIQDNDAVVFFNFRIDRPRQLSRAFVLENIQVTNQDWGFDPYAVKYEKKHEPAIELPPVVIHRGEKLKNLYFVMMTEYGKFLAQGGAHAAFPPELVTMPLGQVLSINTLHQLRAAESEKERFVTYYFNGQVEKPFALEDRLIVPSPDVATYDLKPEMSAHELTKQIITKIQSAQDYSFILVNFANADMVGHTGNLQAAIQAVEHVDQCLGELFNTVNIMGGVMLITADHGNAESMIHQETGKAETEHTSSMVPFIALSDQFIGKFQTLQSGILADVAPTILALLGVDKPSQMMGRNLLAELT